MTDHTADLIAVLAALDTRILVFDGLAGIGTGPRLNVYGGALVPENRRYGFTTPNRGTVWRIVCVSNTQSGSRRLSKAVTDRVDGHAVGGSLLNVRHVGQPQEDRDDPSEWRWSSTVEVTHHI